MTSRGGDDGGRVVERVFSPTPDAVVRARTFSRDVSELREPELAEALELMVSELSTNVVLHARTPFTLRLERDRSRIRVEVIDASPVLPVQRETQPLATTGRGLKIVGRLADRWGAERVDDGKRVWFEIRLAGQGAGDDRRNR